MVKTPPFNKSALVSSFASGMYSDDNILTEEWRGRSYEFTVSRGPVDMAAVFGGGCYSRSSDTLRLSREPDTPTELYVWAERTECHDDSYNATVRPHKQHCRLDVVLDELDPAESGEHSLLLHIMSDGLRLYTLTPVDGETTLAARWDEVEEKYCFFIPRQWQDSPLTLELYNADDGFTEPVVTLDIGPALTRMGYDWTKTDLDDAEITIDSATATFSVNVTEWTIDNLIYVEI